MCQFSHTPAKIYYSAIFRTQKSLLQYEVTNNSVSQYEQSSCLLTYFECQVILLRRLSPYLFLPVTEPFVYAGSERDRWGRWSRERGPRAGGRRVRGGGRGGGRGHGGRAVADARPPAALPGPRARARPPPALGPGAAPRQRQTGTARTRYYTCTGFLPLPDLKYTVYHNKNLICY